MAGTGPAGVAIITGANGGMGRACARQLGLTRELVLTDASPRLNEFARELELEGFIVRAALVGDFREAHLMQELERYAVDGFSALAHTCGLPPAAAWRDIIEVNYLASIRLLRILTPYVGPGTAAVLIASVAGHLAPSMPEAEALMADEPAPDLFDRLELLFHAELGHGDDDAMGLLAYAMSKKGVMGLCRSHAASWGERGARIVSISPGMIYTTMGRESAATSPIAEEQVRGAPAHRWGTPGEIASAASFLLSNLAGFITGTDLLVDGGAVGMLRALDVPPWIETLRKREIATGSPS